MPFPIRRAAIPPAGAASRHPPTTRNLLPDSRPAPHAQSRQKDWTTCAKSADDLRHPEQRGPAPQATPRPGDGCATRGIAAPISMMRVPPPCTGPRDWPCGRLPFGRFQNIVEVPCWRSTWLIAGSSTSILVCACVEKWSSDATWKPKPESGAGWLQRSAAADAADGIGLWSGLSMVPPACGKVSGCSGSAPGQARFCSARCSPLKQPGSSQLRCTWRCAASF